MVQLCIRTLKKQKSMQNTWLGKVFLFRGQIWTFSQKSPFTHDGKTKTVTPGEVENHQQDLK